jgi:C4-dicarboxylate transporter, DctM subunit
MDLQKILSAVFGPFDVAARAWSAFWRGVRTFLREFILLKVIFTLILVIGAIYHYLSKVFGVLDKVLDRFETTLIFLCTVGMTSLVFLDFLDRELDFLDLGLQGATKLSLLLMMWVAFLGASLATRDDKHLIIDAADRALSPVGSARLYRVSMAISAVFSWQLFGASVKVVKKHFNTESLAKLTVPEWATEKLNAWTAWALEGRLSADDYQYFLTEGGFAVALGQDELKLWVAELVLPVAFLLMSLRFAGKFFAGRSTDVELDDIPARHVKRNPGTAGTRDMVLAGLFPGLLLGMLAGLLLGQAWLIVVCAILLLLVGAPLFVVIGVAATLCVVLLEGRDLTFIVKDIYKATDKEVLLAIPFFVMAGAIMTEGSIARRLIDMAKAAIGWFPGGLAMAGVISCMVFAAISGSSPVTVIAIGSIMVPALIDAGYDEKFSLGLLTSAGSLGILIPPSIPMIIYGVVCFTDPSVKSAATGAAPTVKDLFVAGIGPGLFIGGLLMAWAVFRERDKVLPIEETLHELPRTMMDGIWAAGLPVLIIGGIYSGLFTATEAAAVSVVYAIVVEFVIHPALKLRKRGTEPLFELSPLELPRVFRDSSVVMGSLLLIIVLAITFNQFLVFQEVPNMAADWVKSHVDSKLSFLILVNLFLLLLGCMMDIMSAILIVAPLLAPIAVSRYGIDPVHFGIIFIVNLEIGYLTPPLGLNLFVASSVFDKPIVQVIRSVLPFTLLMLVALAAIAFFPSISLFLLGP